MGLGAPMKIGTLTGSISRHAGGLFDAVQALDCASGGKGVTLRVFGLRDSETEADKGHWGSLNLSLAKVVGPEFFGFAPALLPALVEADLDLIHVHGIWKYPSVVASRWSRRVGKPYVVSAHGMLDPWALNHSRWKKRLAYLAFEGAHLHGAACLRALCASEAESMRAFGLHNPIAIIPNGVHPPDLAQSKQLPAWASRLPKETKVLFFLSRLHPKKGLQNLLRAWAQVWQPRMLGSGDWHLVIAGWEQGGHQAELEQLAAALGIQPGVHFVGPQFGTDKTASFRHADAFILPSVSEGLPLAVLEAWSYSLPVLMTPQCNLPVGFETGSALAIQPEVNSIATGLQRLFKIGDGELRQMGERGRELVEQNFAWSKIGPDMVGVYEWLLEKGPRPEFVRLD
jgi:poly(glycerol-phosphate) alpha-glucosyltransferase